MSAEVSNRETPLFTSGSGNVDASNQPPAKTNNNCLEIGSKKKDKSFSEPRPPDGGWGWVVVFGSFMLHVIGDGIIFSFGVFVENLVDYFESSKSAVGGIGSLIIGMSFFSGNMNLNYVYL